MQAVPKVVTPTMEEILRGVAAKVHDQRMAAIHARPVYLLPHQAGDLLGPSKEQRERRQRQMQHRYNSTIAARGRWPGDPRPNPPQVCCCNPTLATCTVGVLFEGGACFVHRGRSVR